MTNSTLLDDPDFAPAGSAHAKAIDPVIQAELADGERLVWVGHPRRNPAAGALPPIFRGLCLFTGGMVGLLGMSCVLIGLFDQPGVIVGVVMFGLCLGMISLVILVVGLRDLLGVLLPGTAILAAPDPIQRWFERRARATRYALTDRRIILWEPAGYNDVRVRSLRRKDLSGISRTQRADGSGDLFLEVMAHSVVDGSSAPVPLGSLRKISEVRAVEVLIRATLFDD